MISGVSFQFYTKHACRFVVVLICRSIYRTMLLEDVQKAQHLTSARQRRLFCSVCVRCSASRTGRCRHDWGPLPARLSRISAIFARAAELLRRFDQAWQLLWRFDGCSIGDVVDS